MKKKTFLYTIICPEQDDSSGEIEVDVNATFSVVANLIMEAIGHPVCPVKIKIAEAVAEFTLHSPQTYSNTMKELRVS